MENRILASPPSLIYRQPYDHRALDRVRVTQSVPLQSTPEQDLRLGEELGAVSPIKHPAEADHHSDSNSSLEGHGENITPAHRRLFKPRLVETAHRKCVPEKPKVNLKDHPAKHQKTVAFGRTTNVSQTIESAKELAAYRQGFKHAVSSHRTAIQPIMESTSKTPECSEENKENVIPQTKVVAHVHKPMKALEPKADAGWRACIESSQKEILELKKEVSLLKTEMEELKKKDAQRMEMLLQQQVLINGFLFEKRNLNTTTSTNNDGNKSLLETVSAKQEGGTSLPQRNKGNQQERREAPKMPLEKLIADERRRLSPKLQEILSSDADYAMSLLSNDNGCSIAVSATHIRTPVQSYYRSEVRPTAGNNHGTPNQRRYTVEHPPEAEVEEFPDFDPISNNRRSPPTREERRRYIDALRERIHLDASRRHIAEDEFDDY